MGVKMLVREVPIFEIGQHVKFEVFESQYVKKIPRIFEGDIVEKTNKIVTVKDKYRESFNLVDFKCGLITLADAEIKVKKIDIDKYLDIKITKINLDDYEDEIGDYSKDETFKTKIEHDFNVNMLSYEQLAEKYGTNRTRMAYLLKVYGIKATEEHQSHVRLKTLLNETKKAGIIKKYLSGKSLMKLASEYHCSFYTARKVILDAGIELHKQGVKKGSKKNEKR